MPYSLRQKNGDRRNAGHIEPYGPVAASAGGSKEEAKERACQGVQCPVGHNMVSIAARGCDLSVQ